MTETEILGTDHPEALDKAISILRSGGLIVLPTDTVYGLAADAWNGQAVRRIYEAKNRSELKSIPVLLSGAAAIVEVAAEAAANILSLAAQFWPGPLTMVVERKSQLPSEVSATDTVGVRAPDDDFALTLLRAYGPLAATSANPSGQPGATTAVQVMETLRGKVDLVLDGGEIEGGVPSTVVDFTTIPPTLLRHGPISMESVLKAWESY